MKTSTCNPGLIDDFLADRLSHEQQTEFERHLDVCPACCGQLQQRTADDVLWHDTQQFLSSTDAFFPTAPTPAATQPGAFIPGPFIPAKAADSGTGEAADSQTSLDDRLRLDFLNPTDDPHMLGRFAGYEISGVVGYGGMGIVLKGHDPALNRFAAIKVLAPHYATSGSARQRFAREAQAAAAVVHDNVIAIHGVSECNALPYLIMPYIKGQSLQKRIDRDGPLSVAEILRIAMQTARGLAAAHAQGLVHRDIKPANLLLPENVERVLITDFGLARAADDASLTRSGVIAGTPQYMSPEQARGERLDHRSDLFSLGSVMYAMTTGHPPFRAETPYGVLRRITDHPHRPIQEVRTDIPAWLCQLIDQLLSKNVANRIQTAEQLAGLLEQCLAHLQQPTQVPLPSLLKTHNNTTRRRPWLNVSTRLLVVPLIVVGTLGLWFGFAPRSGNALSDGTASPSQAAVTSASEHSSSQESPAVMPQNSVAPSLEELQWQTTDELSQIEGILSELHSELVDTPP